MFCVKCGNKIDNDTVFCPKCGANNAQRPNNVQYNGNQTSYNHQSNNIHYSGVQANYNQQFNNGQSNGNYINYNQQPNNGQFNNQYNGQYNPQFNNQYNAPFVNPNQSKMNWYTVMVYFMLFANAVWCVLSSFVFFVGARYANADFVYDFFEGLQSVDIFIGLLYLCGAVLAIVARFSLLKFEKKGPMLVTVFYAYMIVINIIYYIALSSVAEKLFDTYNFIGDCMLMTGYAVLLLANLIYLKKRSHLFVN